MIIKYKFADGSISEVEVDVSLGKIIKELEREEYNNNQKETRRHVQLSALNPDGDILAADDNVLNNAICNLQCQELLTMVGKLKPEQQRLFRDYYINGKNQSEIAKLENVTRQAISLRLKKLCEILMKF